MINKIDNVSFSSRFCSGGYSKHTPVQRHYEEFYFMPELQKKNPIKVLCKKIGEMYGEIRNSMKPKNKTPFEPIENIKGTTIEI